MRPRSLLLIVSGPSGAGKGTALSWITERFPEFQRVATYTTRAPRPNEVDGVDYRFVDAQTFAALKSEGEIVEDSSPYGDYSYGSPRDFVEDDDRHLAVELDYRGFARYQQISQRRVVGILILPPTLEHVRERISLRHAESNMQARASTVREMAEVAPFFDYVLVNDDRAVFLERLSTLLAAELIRWRGLQYTLSAPEA